MHRYNISPLICCILLFRTGSSEDSSGGTAINQPTQTGSVASSVEGKILSLYADVSQLTLQPETVIRVEGRVVAVTASKYYSRDLTRCTQLLNITLVRPPTFLDAVEVTCATKPPERVDDFLINVGNLVYIHGKNTDPLLGVFVMSQGHCFQRVYGDKEYGVFKKKVQARLEKDVCEKVISDRKPKIFTNKKPPPESSGVQKLPAEFVPKIGKILRLDTDTKGYTPDSDTVVSVKSHVVSVAVAKHYKEGECVQVVNMTLNRPFTLLDSVTLSCDAPQPTRVDEYLINVGGLVHLHGKNTDPLLGVFVMNPALCYQRVYGDKEYGVYPKRIQAHLDGRECQQVLSTRRPMVFGAKPPAPSEPKRASQPTPTAGTIQRSAADIADYQIINDQKVAVLNGDTYSFQKDTSSSEVVHGRSFYFTAQRYVRGEQCFQLVTAKKLSNHKTYDQFKISCEIVPPFRVKKFGINYGNIVFEDGDFELVLVVKDGICLRRSYWLAGDTVDKKDLVLMEPQCAHITKKTWEERRSGVIPEAGPPDPSDTTAIDNQKVVVLNGNIFGYKPVGRLRVVQGRKLTYNVQTYERGRECVKVVTLAVSKTSYGRLDQVKICCGCDQYTMRWGKRFNIGHLIFEDDDMRVVFVVKDGICVRRSYTLNEEDDVIIVDERLSEGTCNTITKRTKGERSSGVLPHEIPPDDAVVRLVKENKVVALDGNVFSYRQLKYPQKVDGGRFTFEAVKFVVSQRLCVMLITVTQPGHELVFDEVKASCDTTIPSKVVGVGVKIDGIIFEEPPSSIVFVVKDGLCIRRNYRVVEIDVVMEEAVLEEAECFSITKRSKEDRSKGVFPDRLPPPVDDYEVMQRQKVAVLSENVNGYSVKGTETKFESKNFVLTMLEYIKDEECVKRVTLTRKDHEYAFDMVKIPCEVVTPNSDDYDNIEWNFGNIIYVQDYNQVMYVVRDGRCVMRSYWVRFGEVTSIDRILGEKECSKRTRWSLKERQGEAKLNKEAPVIQEKSRMMQILSLNGTLPQEYMPLDTEQSLGQSTLRLSLTDHFWERCARVAILYCDGTEVDRLLMSCGPVRGFRDGQKSVQYHRALAAREDSDSVEALYNNGDGTCTKRLYQITSDTMVFWKKQVTMSEEKVSNLSCQRLISGRKYVWADDSEVKETNHTHPRSNVNSHQVPDQHSTSSRYQTQKDAAE